MGKYRRVAGTCHQGYPYFTDRFAGRQCTVIALVALAFAFMRAGQLWQTRDVDDIVREGHQRYIEIISFSNVGLRNLQHNEVPRFLHQFMGDADLDISVLPNSVYGIVGQEGNTDSGSVGFDLALRQSFQRTPSVLATFSEYTVAIFYDQIRNVFMLYDSHACNADGIASVDGLASLFEFTELDSLISFVAVRHRNSLFELSNIEVSYSTENLVLQSSSRNTATLFNAYARNSDECINHKQPSTCSMDNIPPRLDSGKKNSLDEHYAVNNSKQGVTVDRTPFLQATCNLMNESLCGNHVSMHMYHDHDYCSKQQTSMHMYHDHDYCSKQQTSMHINHDHDYCSKQQTEKKNNIPDITSDHSYSLSNGILDVSEGNSLQFGMPFEPLSMMYEKLYPQPAVNMHAIESENSLSPSHVRDILNAQFVTDINMCPDYICCVCHRILFQNQIKQAAANFRKYGVSQGDVLCSWCFQGISKDRCPLSVSQNKLFTGHTPVALQGLSTIEKRCISLINTFFSLVILPALPVGQFGMKGLVIHLPLPVSEVSAALNGTENTVACVYPSSYSQVPHVVNKIKVQHALKWLSENNHLYQHLHGSDAAEPMEMPGDFNANIDDCIEMGSIDRNYTLPSQQFSNSSSANTYTLPLQSNFVNITSIQYGEEKAFPALFPYGINGYTSQRPIKLSLLQYYRSRFYNIDDKWRTSIPYLLSSVGCYERKRLFELISVYMRVQNKNGHLRVSDVLQTDLNQNLLKNSYMFMKNIRGTCAYWKDVLYNLLAMIKNLGCPTFFVTLSSNDYHWPELANLLKVPLKDLPTAVQKNPLLTALYFERRWRALLKNVLKGKKAPLGDIEDFFGRIEFQQRGSPHIHFFVWTKNAPCLYTSDSSTLVSFIDSTISTIIPDQTSNPTLHKLVKKLQIHSHRSSCKRRNACRFHFPYEPCDSTRILSAVDVHHTKKFYETRRTEHDTMVNAYNPTILLHWQANMDIQMIDGPIGIAYYVCSYICKAEPDTLKNALSETLKNFEMSSCSPSLRSRLSKIGFCVLKHRTLSAQEAAYRIGHLQLVWYSRPIVKVVAVTPENTYKRLKPRSHLEQLSSNSTDIFDHNIVDYYYSRPSILKNLSLFSFARSWIVKKKQVSHCESYKLHLSETLYCQKRSKPAVVRITKPARGTDDYFYSLLLLFFPHDTPDMLVKPFTSAKDSFIARHEQFDRTALNIGYRMEDIDSVISSLHLFRIETDSVAAPNTAENNTEALPVENVDFLSNFVNFPPNNTDKQTEENIMSPSDITLNEQQWHSFSTGIDLANHHEHCSKLTRDQTKVLEFVKTRSSSESFHIFITGPGGVGKSFLIRVLVEYLTLFTAKVSGIVPVSVLAPTGVAAFNIKGRTIHSSLRIPVQHGYVTEYTELSARNLQKLRSTFENIHTILIDEISMVSSSMLEHIHLRLQSIKNNNLPFGGLNIILVGDFFQLRPVKGHFAFYHSLLWPLFRPFFLTQNVRQSNDAQFSQLLNRIRLGYLHSADIDLLKTRLVSENAVDPNILHIYPTCESVQRHNTRMQNLLEAPQTVYNAVHYFSDNDLEPNMEVTDMSLIPDDDRDAGGLPSSLTFSVGTRVMLLRNLCVAYGLVNGAQGYVTGYHFHSVTNRLEYIYVVFDNTDSIPAGVKRQDGSVPIPVYKQEQVHNSRNVSISSKLGSNYS